MAVNYNDKRFTQVNSDKQVALNENEKLYNDMIGQSDSYYNNLVAESQKWADKQTEIQQQQSDLAIQKIEQQKDQTHKDYIKEQTGAYLDWQKQIDPYGVNAEVIASKGLTNSGYAETSKVAMYTAYQSRVATARESYERSKLNYENMMTEARLQNSSKLAEIAYNAHKEQLEYALQGFQHKNTLLQQKAQAKRDIDNTYYARYQDVLNQINYENAQAEAKRQHDEQMKFQKEQFDWQKAQASKSSGSGGGGYSSSKKSSSSSKSSSGGSANSSKSSSGTVSAKAKMDLGYGPINDEAVENLVKAGAVKVVTDKNGKNSLQKTPSAPKKLNNASTKPSTALLKKRMFG